jgi:hypothetical protein
MMHDMAHQHARSHHMRRQPQGPVEVVTEIIIATDTGDDPPEPTKKPVALPPPATRARESTTAQDDDQPEETARPTRRPSSTQNSDDDDDQPARETNQPKSTIKPASTLMIATKPPTPSPASSAAGLISATAAISASATSSSTAAADSESGMSTGAMAGLALGILVAICAILTGILLVYRRKKKQMAAAAQENEKTEMHNAPAPPPPQVMAAAAPAVSIRSAHSAETAPRLSLRPVTQFDPSFEQRKSGANLLNAGAAAAGAAGAAKPQSLSPSAASERPSSAWERRGAANASAADPFKDPDTPSGPSSANPFGNKAAVDAQQASIPDSPPNASPLNSAMHSSKPSANFADPGAAIAAAEAAPVAVAVSAAKSIPPPPASEAPTSELPAPPTAKSNSGSVPSTPAATEGFPASPGPAPTGPPPIAGAVVGNGPQSPALAPGLNNVHRVQLDFKPSMQDELELHAGQLVRMLHEYDDGWVSLHVCFAKTILLIILRRFVSVWTALSKVSFPVHACLSTLSSPVKARPQATCAALLSARPWVLVMDLSRVLFPLL